MANELKYQFVSDKIYEKIQFEEYPAGSKIPSEDELADIFGVSRVTIRHALKYLEEKGYLTRERGKGTFVKTRMLEKRVGKVVSFTESTKMLGNVPSSKVLSIEKRKCPLITQNYLGISDEDEVWVINRIRYVNNLEVLYEESYWVTKICGSITKEIAEGSIVEHLKSKNINLAYGKQELIALNADAAIANNLDVSVGFPLIKSTMTFFTRKHDPIFISINYYRTDRMAISISRNIDDN